MSLLTLPTELELLRIQHDGSFDHRDRVLGLYGITIVSTQQGQALWIGADVPDALATELAAAFDRAPRSTPPGASPPALARCRQVLDSAGRSMQCSGGPSFLIEEGTHLPSGVHIARSDTSSRDGLRNGNPGNWHPIEWDELLDGRLGPWTIATEGELVVSICHTPGPVRARAVECGVWTRAAFRGRGHAAAVVSEWAALMRPSGRYLFYSTTARISRRKRSRDA